MSALLLLLASCAGNKEQTGTQTIVKTEKTVRYSGGNGQEYTFISRPYRTSNCHSG